MTPPLSTLEAGALAKIFAEILAAAPVASALLRFARGSEREAGAIAPMFLSAAMAADCALLIESDARMAARLGADGVHVSGAGEALVA
ncbi:MAG: thiamine phosphate synthase, partial [Hyphomicrobiales bacterium]|nr:thiamine phosphate synthase [Hyphomicrobiales bacterium]